MRTRPGPRMPRSADRAATRRLARPPAAFSAPKLWFPTIPPKECSRRLVLPHRPGTAPTTCPTSAHSHHTEPHSADQLHTRPIAAFFCLETLVSEDSVRRMQPEAGSPIPRDPPGISARPPHRTALREPTPRHHATTRPIAAFSGSKSPVPEKFTRKMQREAGSREARMTPRPAGGEITRAWATLREVTNVFGRVAIARTSRRSLRIRWIC